MEILCPASANEHYQFELRFKMPDGATLPVFGLLARF